MKQISRIFLSLSIIFYSTFVLAQSISLEKYLENMDKTEITFSGHIRYSDGFRFYNKEKTSFEAFIDAGRNIREQIQTECENSDWLITISDFCSISGSGTIEIEGSQISISIENVEYVGKE